MSMSGHPLPTPECIDVSSVTPDSVKSPTPPPVASNAPDNNTEGCTTAAEDRSGSPPPSCPICLGTYKNKCFTDSCLHQFCFNCLLEWSKIKAECPLCKQSFKSIIHNVKSEREFEEYLVQQPLHYNLMLSEPIRFSYSTTLRVRPSQSEALQRLFLHHPSLTDRYTSYPRNERPNVRRRIYERGLYALPLFDITGRARECSAEFYRANPAQIHRLIPFLNREAIHVIQDSRSVSSLLQRATEILTTHDITSAEFRRLVEPYFRENTVHFIHELYNFARSPYDLYGYDNNVQYSQDYNLALHMPETDSQQQQQGMRTRSNVAGSSRSAGASTSAGYTSTLWSASNPNTSHHNDAVVNVLSSSSSSLSGSDEEAASNRSPASTAAVGVVRRENVSVIQTNPATASTSTASHPLQQPATQIKTEQQRVESVIRTAGEPSVKIELSDTDTDECQFVLERKPPHLRTPEYVSLNSEEDSDVVFVNQSTDGPVMPSKELPRHLQPIQGTASLSPSSRLSLMEDIRHLPTFMPYMYGMDAAEPGPSTATGIIGMAGPSSAGAPPGPVDLKHSQNASKLNLKHEDPMLAGPSSSFAGVGAQRRKRKSQRRQPQGSGGGSGMLNWSSSEDDNEGYAAEDIHGGPSGNARRRRIAPPTSYAASSTADTESSHDEYKASSSSRVKAVPKKKPQTPNKSLRKLSQRRSRGSGKMKKEALRAMRFREEQERLKVQQQQEKEKEKEKAVVQQEEEEEDKNTTETSNSSSESSSSSNSSNNSGTDEEINVRDETVTQHQRPPYEQPQNQMEDIQVDGQQSKSSSSRNENDEEEDEDDEDLASNQGSVATSASQRTTSMGSDSEEIDVQNDEFDN